jgi:hypothetical protein
VVLKKDFTAIVRIKIPALGGLGADNNRRILKEIALHGSKSQYDLIQKTKIDKGTISRRVNYLHKKSYLGITKKIPRVRAYDTLKNLYGLTWKGLIASLYESDVRANIVKVLSNNPLMSHLPLGILFTALRKYRVFTERELEQITKEFFIQVVQTLPSDIEVLENLEIATFIPPVFNLLEKYLPNFDEQKRRNLLSALDNSGLIPELRTGFQEWKSRLEGTTKRVETLVNWLESE